MYVPLQILTGINKLKIMSVIVHDNLINLPHFVPVSRPFLDFHHFLMSVFMFCADYSRNASCAIN